jgi:hypothetical protein
MSLVQQDKDLFREHFSLLLSRRLLTKKSISDDLERFGTWHVANKASRDDLCTVGKA